AAVFRILAARAQHLALVGAELVELLVLLRRPIFGVLERDDLVAELFALGDRLLRLRRAAHQLVVKLLEVPRAAAHRGDLVVAERVEALPRARGLRRLLRRV